MRVGITGGAGFIGSNLAKSLFEYEHEVFILDNFSTGFKKNLEDVECTLIEGDLKNQETVKRFLLGCDLQYVYHLGAVGSVPRSIDNPLLSFENNAVATLNVLEAAREKKIPILFSSSSSVYGKNPKLPKEEIDWLSPISPYAAAKLSAEAMCLAYAESFGMEITIFRLFNVYGPKQNPDGAYAAVIPKWIRAAREGKPLQIYGDGEQSRDFTFVNDVTMIMSAVMKSNTGNKGPINLAFGTPVTLNQIVEVFGHYFGRVKVEYLPERKGDIRNSESNPNKLFSLGISPNQPTDIREGLKRTFEWFESRDKLD